MEANVSSSDNPTRWVLFRDCLLTLEDNDGRALLHLHADRKTRHALLKSLAVAEGEQLLPAGHVAIPEELAMEALGDRISEMTAGTSI